jgi:hypothetical protein
MLNKTGSLFVQNFVFLALRDIANHRPGCYNGVKFQGIVASSTVRQRCQPTVLWKTAVAAINQPGVWAITPGKNHKTENERRSP